MRRRLHRELPEAAEGFERALLMYECFYFENPNHPDWAKALHHLAGKFEEMGFTVRRCGTWEEVVERTQQLLVPEWTKRTLPGLRRRV